MSSEWYLMAEGVVKGPVTAKQLRGLAEAGKLSPMDRVRRNDGQWVEASRVKGLFEYGFEPISPNGHESDSRPVATGELPGGSSTRGLPGVTSIKQCIARDEKKKRSSAIMVSLFLWLLLGIFVIASWGIILIVWFITWVINRMLSEYHVRKLQAVGTIATAD